MASKQIALRLNDSVLRKIEEIAKKEKIKKTDVIRKAILLYLDLYEKGTTMDIESIASDILELKEKVKELETKYDLVLDRLNATNSRIDALIERISRLEQWKTKKEKR